MRHDSDCSTRTFEPNAKDWFYSTYRPDLAAPGATGGRMPSSLTRSNNDALSRRDQGVEFLDVTEQVTINLINAERLESGHQEESTASPTTAIPRSILISC